MGSFALLLFLSIFIACISVCVCLYVCVCLGKCLRRAWGPLELGFQAAVSYLPRVLRTRLRTSAKEEQTLKH